MPDITGSPAIDVAIGLAFVFFMLSLICSTINELIATALSWRSETLERGLRSMLAADGGDPQAPGETLLLGLARHPLIRGKVEKPAAAEPAMRGGGAAAPAATERPRHGLLAAVRRRLPRHRDFPSYLAPETFALAFLDTVVPPKDVGDENLIRRAEKFVSGLKADDPLRTVLLTALEQAEGDLARFRQQIEHWYDNTMARVSGWYRRKVQVALVVIATIVTLAFNADTLQIGRALWSDDALRASVVAQAQKAVDDAKAPSDLGGTTSGTDTLAAQVGDVEQLQLPIGWSFHRDDPRWFDSFGGLLGKLAGLLTTVVALTLGAPFWFDLLGRVARVRSTGRPERGGAA